MQRKEEKSKSRTHSYLIRLSKSSANGGMRVRLEPIGRELPIHYFASLEGLFAFLTGQLEEEESDEKKIF
ncbi:MAG: hypothetical protein AAF902_01950 [Chloroflexota bacterium]